MGYKSRADERGWNGASRKVLEHQTATHMARLKSVPLIYSTVEKLGVRDSNSDLVLICGLRLLQLTDLHLLCLLSSGSLIS